jgi:hypothetical protein
MHRNFGHPTRPDARYTKLVRRVASRLPDWFRVLDPAARILPVTGWIRSALPINRGQVYAGSYAVSSRYDITGREDAPGP